MCMCDGYVYACAMIKVFAMDMYVHVQLICMRDGYVFAMYTHVQ